MAGSPFNPVTATAFSVATSVEAVSGRSTMLSVVARRSRLSARALDHARRHPPAKRRRVSDSTFVVLVNGTFGPPPAAGVLEYLLAQDARRVTAVSHPLNAEDGDRHEITTYEPGRDPRRRGFRLPARPPYTYPLDVVVPPRLPRADVWVAFNNLLCARGLLERRMGRVGQVLYWAVDFVPDRFGKGSPLTRAYDALDVLCCRDVDLRVELSRQALAGRDARLRLGAEEGAPRAIAPVGAWIDRVPVVPEDGWRSRRVVFIGHLVERMGGDTVIEAMAVLAERGIDVTADIAGHGPMEQQLRDRSARLGLDDRVRFHGFISDHRRLEHLLSEAAVALAPYSTRVESFTRYADPSKLKSYLAAGLPILLTDVPPNAHDLVAHAGAQLIADDPVALADAIEHTLADPAGWRRRRLQARRYARQFDWSSIVGGVLKLVGLES
jgi:glycosyltransferase involved in cell wall biosynthesis